MDFLDRVGLETPVVQAGMGGGLSGHGLAAAVSGAGGLGTIGFLAPDGLRAEVAAARRVTDRPLAVNLLLPFARADHFEAASNADVVVTFWGKPRRRTSKIWIHQCGSVEEAQAAAGAGADAVIAQGVEAGGTCGERRRRWSCWLASTTPCPTGTPSSPLVGWSTPLTWCPGSRPGPKPW